MNSLKILKSATNLTVGLGVGTVIGNIVAATTPAETKIITKILIRVGSFALGTVIGDQAGKAVEDIIDTTTDEIKNIKTTFNEAKKQAEDA